MQLRRDVVDAYNAAIKNVGNDAKKTALQALKQWFELNPDAEIADTRDYFITVLQGIGTSFGQKAGDIAYALRDLAAEAAGIELPDVDYAYEAETEYVEKTVRYQVGKLKDKDVDGFTKAISDAARYFAERGANDTMANLGKQDAKKLGNRVRFARVPTGATTCPYCLMLASRGFVYHSELTALNANHRYCDCRIVEGFDGMKVEGYDPDLYYDMWKHPERYESITPEENASVASGDHFGISKKWYRQFNNEVLEVRKADSNTFRREGEPWGIEVTDAEAKSFRNGQARHTHTTEIGGTFSEEDIDLTVNAWLLSHDVYDTFNDATYTLRRMPEATHESAELFAQDYSRYSSGQLAGIYDYLYEKYDFASRGYQIPTEAESIEAEKMLRAYQHEWLKENASKYGYDYK